MASLSEPPITPLINQAEALASRRHEHLCGVHLLAALGASGGGVRDLLEEKQIDFRRVLDHWEQMPGQGGGENMQLILAATKRASRRFGARTPTASHLLLALLNDPQGAARKVLDKMGADSASLRSAAMQLAQGLPMRRRGTESAALGRSLDRSEPSGDRPSSSPGSVERPRGVAVPLVPLDAAGRSSPHVPRRSHGQALSVIPQVGPTPLPGQRLRREPDGPSATRGAPPEPVRSQPAKDDAGDETRAAENLEADESFARLSLPKKKFPILTQVGVNLTLQAARGQVEDVVGRDEEIEQALDVLAKRHGNNPCLIGPSGVGKTSVARGVAARLAELDESGDEDRIVIEMPISELVAGTGVRGALAGRLSALKKEVRAAQGRVILFFDEIHQLFSGEAAEEIAADLKLSLSRGELPCIGATSAEQYRRVIEGDPALSRRFSAVEVEEPSREDAFLVLSAVARRLETHHGVVFDEEALALAIAWSVRYLPGRALPDKAVSIVDLAGARARRRRQSRVTPEAVAEVVAAQANMPVERLLESDADRMLGLHEMLCARVIGHEAHLERIARILRRNAAGLGGRRPIGTFLLLGPTGVGKTETAKAIAEVLFHNENAMTRVDMAEMSESHAVAKLIGAPPGYVGHDAGGQLTEAVRRRPYQVLLLDEIEKAHPEVLTAFLAVFDEGRMTDSRGRLVDFTNTVIILTSNLGAEQISASARKRVGFRAVEDDGGEDVSRTVVGAAKRALPPELFNRLDEVLAFAPLQRSDVRKIGRKLCQALADELELSRGIFVQVSDAAIELLLDEGGFDPEFGARPLKRTLARRVEAPLAEALLQGELTSADTWVVDARAGKLEFSVRAGASAAE